MRFPPGTEALTGEPTGVVTEAQIQVAPIVFDVVKAVRIDHAKSRTGKIVVPCLLGLLGVQSALTEEKSQEFLVFGIHTDDRVGGFHEYVAVLGDDLKLLIAIRMASHRQSFARLPLSQAMAFQKL